MGLLEKDPAQRLDVQTARTILRQQFAGPLASKRPPHMMTDPYSVVPAQRAGRAGRDPADPAAQPSGQIGGRAMLAPGESLTDHLAKLEQENAPTSGGGGRRRAADPRACCRTSAHTCCKAALRSSGDLRGGFQGGFANTHRDGV